MSRIERKEGSPVSSAQTLFGHLFHLTPCRTLWFCPVCRPSVVDDSTPYLARRFVCSRIGRVHAVRHAVPGPVLTCNPGLEESACTYLCNVKNQVWIWLRGIMQKATVLVLFTGVLLAVPYTADCDKLSTEEAKAQKLPPCAACRALANSFKKGIESTKREKFDGGDSAWEEDKLGSYSTSETRLIEIQERLCKDVERGETQCHSLAEELESKIEEWWFKHQQTHPDIFDYLCVEQTERCCPKDHYGPECTPCPGYPDTVCNNNGKCKRAGTRKGDGGCLCDKGYQGEMCSECAEGYYESYRDEKKFLCSACHAACDGTCKGPGPNSCDKCKSGWYLIAGKGCFDINECIKSDTSCPGNQFCINKEGGFACMECDRACDKCTGDGPDMCIKCAEGYHKKDNFCINSDILGRKWHENLARYTTYFGLCVATCIIFHRNIYLASVIGLVVGVYISVSEYMIAHSDVQDTTANVDILGPA